MSPACPTHLIVNAQHPAIDIDNHVTSLAQAVPQRAGGLVFAAFILLNAVLFVRPTDLLSLEGWNPYEWLIIACSVLAAPSLARQFGWRSLMTSPITALVLALMGIV